MEDRRNRKAAIADSKRTRATRGRIIVDRVVRSVDAEGLFNADVPPIVLGKSETDSTAVLEFNIRGLGLPAEKGTAAKNVEFVLSNFTGVDCLLLGLSRGKEGEQAHEQGGDY